MHRWDVTIPEATEIQKELKRRVIYAPLPCTPTTIAGADISFSRFSDVFHACVVVLSFPACEIVETAYATAKVSFPYVPGYLSFREVPTIVEAYKTLRTIPDVLVMDGHGSAHPRRLGVATHLGLVLDIPTIGCAKSKLFGHGEEPDIEKGSVSHLIDPRDGGIVGTYLRTKRAVKPIIVSPGHRIDLPSSVDIVLQTVRKHRIPEPTRLAHILINEYRKQKISDSV